jgi:hypothetical protein
VIAGEQFVVVLDGATRHRVSIRVVSTTSPGLSASLAPNSPTSCSMSPPQASPTPWPKRSRGGFWVAGASVEAAHHAVTGTVPIDLGDLQSAGVFTDGVSRLVTHHGRSWAELMHLLDSGPRKVIEAVRDADINDPAAIERGKRHDDATAVLCRFPSSAYDLSRSPGVSAKTSWPNNPAVVRGLAAEP